MNVFASLPYGRYIPGQSFVHQLDPRTKIVFGFVYVWLVFVADASLVLAVHFLVAFLTVRASRISVLFFWHGLKGIFFLVACVGFIQLVSIQQGALILSWGWLELHYEGLKHAVHFTLRFILLILIASLLSLTTSPREFAAGLERLFRPLELFGWSAYEFAFMLTVAYRHIPIFTQEIDKMIKSRVARGADFASGGALERIRWYMFLLIPLMISVFNRSEEMALAMEARCFRSGKGRTSRTAIKAGWRDGTAAAILFFLTTLTVLSRYNPFIFST